MVVDIEVGVGGGVAAEEVAVATWNSHTRACCSLRGCLSLDPRPELQSGPRPLPGLLTPLPRAAGDTRSLDERRVCHRVDFCSQGSSSSSGGVSGAVQLQLSLELP